MCSLYLRVFKFIYFLMDNFRAQLVISIASEHKIAEKHATRPKGNKQSTSFSGSHCET